MKNMAEATLAKCQNVGSSLSRNCVERLTQKVLVSARFYFYLLPNACFSVSTSMWGNLFCFFCFFASVWPHDNFILRQAMIYRVNDAKTRPRLNTAGTAVFGEL